MQKLSRKKHSCRKLFSLAHKTAASVRGRFLRPRISRRTARHTKGEVIMMSSKNKNNSQNKSQSNSQNKSQPSSQNSGQNNSQNKSQNSAQN